ncbi:TIGR00375 family protein [Bacillus sp. FJAT-49732]|uniref:TIGR00375 family protein n=1 Tax=Lederbergia citrisecunda TaxID=2833583 RepID=A0A942TP77_9BACI|nr:endonuclease Q family protein [Lederbergia citrisecunda]MBS4199567.1 TIGR00375 family protein [Lederbergia citrisecunda]
MNDFFSDLHIHIGRTITGKPVKITASRNLTLNNILKKAKFPKGLDIVGVIDCHSPDVIFEMEHLIETGKLVELKDGGFQYENGVVLIPGSEIEINDHHCKGPIHVLTYFPTMLSLKEFSKWLSEKVTNIQLSTQRIYEEAKVVQEKVKAVNGLFIPAHVFTPFKSLYGKGVGKSLTEVFNPALIDAVELGLSSDTNMADQLSELHSYSFLTNSDAHSLGKMAREYQVLKLEEPTFKALECSLKYKDENRIVANYGLNPFLGKYYRTTCANCLIPKQEEVCPNCGSKKFTMGVFERITQLADADDKPNRPPYIHQVPLEFIPGLGPKTMENLLNHFGTEMNILHRVHISELKKVVKEDLAELIIQAREGSLAFDAGGGGKYGRIQKLD